MSLSEPQDLHFCWRSKLFADVDIVLESSDGTLSTPFSAHRAILASRCPYFKTLLLGDFADSHLDRFTLPSPPFSPASLVFVLGYMYSGTLDFSNRTFNLDTVFETWRCAAFLSMSTLQDELEGRIVAMVTPQRAPRIYQFAHSPDVNSNLVATTALPLVVDHFEETWATPYIGTLEFDPQMELVTKVRSLVTPITVAKFSRQTRKLRKKVEFEKAGWARNVESMLEAVEKKLVSVIANRLPEIVASPGFIDLVDGVGFSSDVLEWLLLQVFNKDELQEKNAPMAYQALVGSVLLREEGIMIDVSFLLVVSSSPPPNVDCLLGSYARRRHSKWSAQVHQESMGNYPRWRRFRFAGTLVSERVGRWYAALTLPHQ